MAGTRSCRPKPSKSLEKLPGFFFDPAKVRPRISMHGLVSALKGTEFHRISFFASREFRGDMSATGCKLDISSSGSAPIVLHMLQEAIFPTPFLRIIIDPGAGTIGGAGCLVIGNRDTPVGWLGHIIVGGSIGGHGPDFFRIFQG